MSSLCLGGGGKLFTKQPARTETKEAQVY